MYLRSQNPLEASQVPDPKFRLHVPTLRLGGCGGDYANRMERRASKADSCPRNWCVGNAGPVQPALLTSKRAKTSEFLCEICQFKNTESNIKILLATQNKSGGPDWVTGLTFKHFLTHSRPSVHDSYLMRKLWHLSLLGSPVRSF